MMQEISGTILEYIGAFALLIGLIWYCVYRIFKYSDKEPENEKERALKIYKRFKE